MEANFEIRNFAQAWYICLLNFTSDTFLNKTPFGAGISERQYNKRLYPTALLCLL